VRAVVGDIESALEELQAVLATFKTLVGEAAGEAGERVKQDTHEVHRQAKAVREKLLDLQALIEGALRQGSDKAQAAVREKPWQALAIATGAGLLLGFLLGGRPAGPRPG